MNFYFKSESHQTLKAEEKDAVLLVVDHAAAGQARRAAQAPTASEARLTIVRPNSLSAPETLGSWTDSRTHAGTWRPTSLSAVVLCL